MILFETLGDDLGLVISDKLFVNNANAIKIRYRNVSLSITLFIRRIVEATIISDANSVENINLSFSISTKRIEKN